MEIAELKSKTIADLLKIAEERDIPGVSGLRKSELIYKIMESQSTSDGVILAEGVLEILPDGTFVMVRKLREKRVMRPV